MVSEAPASPAGISLAALIRALRTERDLTQELLAERSGLSTRLISDLERGIILRPRRDTVQMMADGLDLSGPERDQFVLIARQGAPASGADQPAISRGPALPASPNALVGRQRELAEIIALVKRSDVRLVTLIGPGGVGKTRTALEAARSLDDAIPGGATLVELAPVTRGSDILDAIARHFAISADSAEDQMVRTFAVLNEAPRMIVLDNLEQIPDAGETIARLLERCPDLQILATSRIILRIRAEQVVQIDPLPVPDLKALPAIGELALVPAVDLLVNRAQSVRQSFAVNDENAQAIAEIVTRLDGLPLAIELAAARLRVMSAPDLLARIIHPLPILTRGPADLPERLQTMRSAIAWSYGLLDEPEQQLVRWLSVFAGGFTLAAAEQVAEAILAESKDSRPANDLVMSLAEKSLIQALAPLTDDDLQGTFRFRMLETIREFGLDLLDQRGERAVARARHASVIANLVQQADKGLSGQDQQFWYEYLELEHDNIRAALQSGVDIHLTAPALRIAGSLYRFWANRGYILEATDWYKAVLGLPGEDPSLARGDCHLGSGVMTYFRGDLEGAESQTREAQAQFLAVGHELGVAYSYGNLGMVADAGGDQVAAVSLYNHALAMFRSLGDKTSEGYMLGNLALVLMDQGDLDRAEALMLQALDHYMQFQNRESMAHVLSSLGEIAQLRGDLAEADSFHRQAMDIRASLGIQTGIAKQLECFAEMAYTTGNDARAAMLYGAAARIRLEIGNPNEPRFDAKLAQLAATMRSRIGERAYSDAWERGVAMTTEEAITEALSTPGP